MRTEEEIREMIAKYDYELQQFKPNDDVSCGLEIAIDILMLVLEAENS